MDVEIKIVIDSIMEKMHQITWYMMELEKSEIVNNIRVNKEEIDNNKFLERLYEKLQEEYSKLKELIEEYILKSNIPKEYEEGDLKEPEKVISSDIANSLPVLLNEIREYIETSYISIGYISSEDEESFFPGIYENTPFDDLNYAEYDLQNYNITCLKQRIEMQDKTERLSFIDKKEILKNMALQKFYKEYAFKRISKDISNIDERFSKMTEAQRKNLMEKFIEQKYVLYMSYLNNKYNGILQEGEKGKLKIAKDLLDNDYTESFLKMSRFEVEANINRDYEDLKEQLEQKIKDIVEEEKRKIQIRNSKNINEKLAKNEKKNAKVTEREI